MSSYIDSLIFGAHLKGEITHIKVLFQIMISVSDKLNMNVVQCIMLNFLPVFIWDDRSELLSTCKLVLFPG